MGVPVPTPQKRESGFTSPNERSLMSPIVLKGALPWRQKPSQERSGALRGDPGLGNLRELCWAVRKCGDRYPWLGQPDGEVY